MLIGHYTAVCQHCQHCLCAAFEQGRHAICATSKSITQHQQWQLTASSCGDVDTLTDQSMTVVCKTTCPSCTHLDSLWAGRTGWLPVALPAWSPFLAAAAAVTLHTTQSFNNSCICQLCMPGALYCFCCNLAGAKILGATPTSSAHVMQNCAGPCMACRLQA